MTRRCSWPCVAAFLWVWMAGTAQATPVQLTPDQMRQAAVLALESGQSARAQMLAEALISRDSSDFSGHLLHARAMRDLGQSDVAKSSARRAWALASTPDQRYSASLVMAQVLASAGHRTRAQLWLRRAVQQAPNKALENNAIRDFRYVRATNPWATRLSFAITPDSNINNGSSERSSFLNYRLSEMLFGEPVEYELGGTARALSGFEYAFGVDTRYRFHQTESRAHDLIAGFDLRLYSLSDEARAIAPNANASDFTFASYRFGYQHRSLNFDRQGEYVLSAEAGQSWYGGDEYARFLRLSASQTYRKTPDLRYGGRISAERQWGVATHDSETVRGDLSVSRKLDAGSWISLAFSGSIATSPTVSEEFTELGLRAQLSLAKPLFGADVIFGLGVRGRDYDVSRHSRDGRQDTRTTADVTFVFREVDYYGFNPTMTVSASSNDSNISLYTSERFGVNFGIQSAF